jgi:hypothetical protein
MTNDSSFVWRPEYQVAVTWTGVAPAIAALIGSTGVLILAFLIYLDPKTRGALKRQSLKMMLCVQGMSIIYSGSYLYAEHYLYCTKLADSKYSGEMLITGPTKWCNVSIILTLFASLSSLR